MNAEGRIRNAELLWKVALAPMPSADIPQSALHIPHYFHPLLLASATISPAAPSNPNFSAFTTRS